MHLPLGFQASLGQCPQKHFPILFVPENVFPPNSAIDDARRAETEREGRWEIASAYSMRSFRGTPNC